MVFARHCPRSTADARDVSRGLGTTPLTMTRRIDEIAEELRIGLQHHAGIVLLHAGFIGLHRAIEREEVRVLAEGFGKDAVTLGIAFAAELLGLRGRLSHQNRDVTIGLRADFLRFLAALSAEFGGLALALR